MKLLTPGSSNWVKLNLIYLSIVKIEFKNIFFEYYRSLLTYQEASKMSSIKFSYFFKLFI